MILNIAGFILATILITCFFNIRFGVALYLAYTFLVPISDITLGPIHLGENFVRMILIVALIYDFKIRHHYNFSWKLILPFILYFVVELLIIPFQSETPYAWMLNSWRVSVMNTLFGAFIVYNVLSQYSDALRLFRNAIILSILIAGIYGIFLTTTEGLNPYVDAIILFTGTVQDAEDKLTYFSADDRMFGRISSVFMHPMSFGLFIGLSFVYTFSIRKKIRQWLFISLIIILSLNALFCGVRSCIGGLVVAIVFYLIFSRNIKLGLITLMIGLLAYNVILEIPEMSDYISSITDIHNTRETVNGSSIDQRLEQLKGCLNEIRNNPIFGKGYTWDRYYHETRGDHPIILAFESLIFVVLCDNGFFGLLIWILLIFLIVKNNHKLNLSDKIVADSFLVFYISYSCITGEYGYMQYFLLLYVCLVFESKIKEPFNCRT